MANPPEKLGSAYYRSFLSPQGQIFYDRLQAQLLRGDFSGKTDFSLCDPETAASDGFAAYKALRDDHPEHFFLGAQSEFTRRGLNGTLTYTMLYTPEIIARVRQQLRKTLCQLVRGTAELSMLQREALVYERIAKRMTYTNHEDARDHNIVGPVLNAEGVCEGQNALLLLCFRRIGIPCVKVYGKTRPDGWHCWTVAWPDGDPVHCDVTWDGAKGGVVGFHYFNLPDRQIGENHFAFQGERVPVCAAENLTYYQLHGLCVRSHAELRARLKRDFQRGVSPIRLQFLYSPASGSYQEEVKSALSEEHLYGNYRLRCYPRLKNVVITTV